MSAGLSLSFSRNTTKRAGFVLLVDSAHDPTSHAVDHPTPDRFAGIVTRKLDDGREFRIVKVFWEPGALAARLRECGFCADILATKRYFIYGTARSADHTPSSWKPQRQYAPQ